MPPSQRCIVSAIEERWPPITVRAMALVCYSLFLMRSFATG